jgi:hypothetical protein
MYKGKHLKENTKRKPRKREIPKTANNVVTVKRPKSVDYIIAEVKSWDD